MNEIKTIDDLYAALCLEGINSVSKLEEAFSKIAGALLNRFAIQKGNKVYRFVEIEFYHTIADKVQGHEGTTYERGIAESCDFFFHPSGVDLCFESNEESYGGILIRSIECEGDFTNGPGKVADKLFDKFSAIRPPKDFPKLVSTTAANDITPMTFTRYNIKGSEKYRYTWPWELWEPKGYSASPWYYNGELKKK